MKPNNHAKDIPSQNKAMRGYSRKGRKLGRPSLYSDDLVERICKRIASGSSFASLGREKGYPCADTLFTWLHEHPAFSDAYARARELRAERWAQEIMSIADEDTTDNVQVQRNRLRVDTRKWALSKLLPRVYGDKQEIHHTGRVELEAVAQANRRAEAAGRARLEAEPVEGEFKVLE